MDFYVKIGDFNAISSILSKIKPGRAWFIVGLLFYTFSRLVRSQYLLNLTNDGLVSEFTLVFLFPSYILGFSMFLATYLHNKSSSTQIKKALRKTLTKIKQIHTKLGNGHYSPIYYSWGVLVGSISEGIYLGKVNLFNLTTKIIPVSSFLALIFVLGITIDLAFDNLRMEPCSTK